MPETYTDVRASIHHVRVADITITAFLSASNFKGKSLEQFNHRSRVAQWLRWQKNKVQKSDEPYTPRILLWRYKHQALFRMFQF